MLAIDQENKISMSYLFGTFLKIGSMAFGGYMALIAVMQKQLAEQDGKLDSQVVLDGTSLASILPGPVAVNTAGYVGYHLRGFWGGLMAMFAVTLPCFILVLLFSVAYFEYGELIVLRNAVTWVTPAIVVIILTVGFNLSKKHLLDFKQYLIALGAFLALQGFGGLWVTFSIMLIGAVFGMWGYRTLEEQETSDDAENLPSALIRNMIILAIALGLIVWVVYQFQSQKSGALATHLLFTFSSMSLTLFGGGYVIIPIIQETIVNSLQWLSPEEFNAALAVSQVTPGPILISAAFIGYKIAGFTGASLATVGIFLPSGLLMIAGSHVLKKYKNSTLLQAAFKGLRPAVIGLIFSSAVTIGFNGLTNWYLGWSFALLLLISLFFKPSTLWIMLMALVIGAMNNLL